MRLPAACFALLALIALAGCVRDAGSPQEYAYGSAGAQRLDFWPSEGRNAPLILFIHGGGWSRGDKRDASDTKARHYVAKGYAFASVNYRLVPDATVEQQAADIAGAIGYLHRNAERLGIDRRKIVLMGHSAGAHLAALVATDPLYLSKATVPMDDLAGAVLLDGAAYYVPSQVNIGGPLIREMRQSAFGSNPKRQLRLSPTMHADMPNAASFLILHVGRPNGRAQAQVLAQRLERAGTPVLERLVADSSHMQLNRQMGLPGDPATRLVDAYIEQAVGHPDALRMAWRKGQ